MKHIAQIPQRRISYTLEQVDLFKHLTENDIDYYDVNPRGMVPVLELEDGQRVTEQSIVAQYMCDKAGRVDLMPAQAAWPESALWSGKTTSPLSPCAR